MVIDAAVSAAKLSSSEVVTPSYNPSITLMATFTASTKIVETVTQFFNPVRDFVEHYRLFVAVSFYYIHCVSVL